MKLVIIGIGILTAGVIALADLTPGEVPENVMAKHNAIMGEDCQKDLPSTPEVYDVGSKAKLYIIPCTMGAYQGSSRAYISEYDGTMISQVNTLDYSELANGVVGSLDLMEAAFDPATGILSTFSKGRGMADCGSSTISKIAPSEYGGISIKTVEVRAKAKCDGKYKDWPVVFKQK